MHFELKFHFTVCRREYFYRIGKSLRVLDMSSKTGLVLFVFCLFFQENTGLNNSVTGTRSLMPKSQM